jgi:probable HAF family extracellular repeat protein
MHACSIQPSSPARALHTLIAILAAIGMPAVASDTYVAQELEVPGGGDANAVAINAFGWVVGSVTNSAREVRGWRYIPGKGVAIVVAETGTELRVATLNDAGAVAGTVTDLDGIVHGFVADPDLQPRLLPDFGGGAGLFPQHLNNSGQLAGYASVSGEAHPFLLTAAGAPADLGTLPDAQPGVGTAAYGLNGAGAVVGSAATATGLNHAFRISPAGASLEDLGTLGGTESWAYAINTPGHIAGTAKPITEDLHGFLLIDGGPMRDLGTLGGHDSAALALNDADVVVGWSITAGFERHAFVWSPETGLRDLNDWIPADSGWILTEATGVNNSGQIAGNGSHRGVARPFVLTPSAGPDIRPPVAALMTTVVTNVSPYAHPIQVIFWDDSGVDVASIGSNSVRVTGPNGYSMPALFSGISPTNNAVKVIASFWVPAPGGLWSGTNNGTYTVAVEPGGVRDIHGLVNGGVQAGTFTVATETTPDAGIAGPFQPAVGTPVEYVFTARGSVPYETNDVFSFTIDWDGDGRDLQTVSGASGQTVAHTFASTGPRTLRVTAVDPHGLASTPATMPFGVVDTAAGPQWEAATPLPGGRSGAIGLNQGGTLRVLGGLPIKGNAGLVQSLAPDSSTWTDDRRLADAAQGQGAGIDSAGRVVVFGGRLSAGGPPLARVYAYDPVKGPGPALASMPFANSDFAFTSDGAHRLYAIGGTGSDSRGVVRYDGAADHWTTLSPLPQPRVGALAVPDGRGHILVLGGTDPGFNVQTTGIYSYDIATDTWSDLPNVPPEHSAALLGGSGSAVLGADGLVYLVGTGHSVFDPQIGVWWFGPNQTLSRPATGVALGDDGFIYVMGGATGLQTGSGQVTGVERLNTRTPVAPQFKSAPPATVVAGNTYRYQAVVSGSPRPALLLVEGPDSVQFDTTTGRLEWPALGTQVGTRVIRIRATSTAGTAEQRIPVLVTPAPTDLVPPSVPEHFIVANRTSTNLTFTWTPSQDNVAVAGYRLWQFTPFGRSRHWGVVIDHITNRSVVFPGGAYTTSYAVSAVDPSGNESARSATVVTSTLLPPAISHVNPSESTVVLAGSGFVYTLMSAGNPASGFSSFAGPPGMTFTRTSGPVPSNAYAVVQWMPAAGDVGTNYFTVTATNIGSVATVTFPVVVLPGATDLTPPTPVGRFTADSVSWDRTQLSWTPAGDNLGVAAYHLRLTHFADPGGTNQALAFDLAGDVTQFEVTGLIPGAAYVATLAASDAAGNQGVGTTLVLTTLRGPAVALRITTTPDGPSLDWDSPGPGWSFTVETSTSLAPDNWVPIAPATQWPATTTHLLLSPDSLTPHRFFRVQTQPLTP